MDGVLIDAMPFHAEAMRLAIKEETKHDINKKVVYLLEGLPGSKLVKEIFKRDKIDENLDDLLYLYNTHTSTIYCTPKL